MRPGVVTYQAPNNQLNPEVGWNGEQLHPNVQEDNGLCRDRRESGLSKCLIEGGSQGGREGGREEGRERERERGREAHLP